MSVEATRMELTGRIVSAHARREPGRSGSGARMVRLPLYGAVTVAIFLLAGNGFILGLHLWAQASAAPATNGPASIHNFHVVDDRLWRGGRPTQTGYRALAARGVTTIVDLRAEGWAARASRGATAAGMDLVRIPIRDGQVPTRGQVRRFLKTTQEAPGIVYVHCMAGVGRTGTMVAAYLIDVQNVSELDALRHNLSVGPPSLEQLSFVAEGIDRPDVAVTALSRILDAPRRLLTYVR